MSTKLGLSALEEELLYVFYDDYLLRHALLSVERLSVSFDHTKNQFFPREFSLVFRTNKGQPLIVENHAYEGFIQTFQTYKRMETTRDEWLFLDELVMELKEEMPRYVMLVEQLIQTRMDTWFTSRAFVPERMDLSFSEQTASITWDEQALSTVWSRAWQRFVAQKKNYFSYMGFSKKQLTHLETLQVVSIEENEKEGRTEVKADILLDGKMHTFSFYKELSHLYVDGELGIEEDSFGGFAVTSTGKLVGEFFEIDKTKGYDFEKTWQSFLAEEPDLYARSLIGFQHERKQKALTEARKKVGLLVKASYVESDTHVIVLEDGSVFKQIND